MKQTIIIYKHNTQKDHNNYVLYIYIYIYIYIIAHLYGSESESYNHEKVNFRLFNAYRRYKVIKVKDGDSAITVSAEIKLCGCYHLNTTLNTKYMKNMCILSYILVSALFQKREKGPRESCEMFYKEKNAYTCAVELESSGGRYWEF